MIYDTTFKNLIVSSFDGNSYGNTDLDSSLLVLYSGDMPTYEEFVADWSALYFVKKSSGGAPIDTGSTGDYGTNVLAAYGNTYGSDPYVNLNTINNEFYLDTTVPPDSLKLKSATPTFAMLMPTTSSYLYSYNGTVYTDGWMETKPFMLMSVSDLDGNGIVKLSTTDMTQSSDAPTLMSLEFEVNMGE